MQGQVNWTYTSRITKTFKIITRENVLNKFIDRKHHFGETRFPGRAWVLNGKRFTVTSENPWPFATLKTWKKLDPVNFRKDLWDRY